MANSQGYTVFMEVSAYITCSLVVVVTLIMLLKVCKGSRAAFLIYLLWLLLISNISYIIYISLYNKRHKLQKCAFQSQNNCFSQLRSVVTASMFFDFLYYATLNCAMWCYCFKFWVVSVEMARLFQIETI
jgi:hypothetical protein